MILTGEPTELHHQDGVLDQQLFSITVRAKPSEIPQHFEVDISEIVVGSAVRVSDLDDARRCRDRARSRDGHRRRPAAAGRPRRRRGRGCPRARKQKALPPRPARDLRRNPAPASPKRLARLLRKDRKQKDAELQTAVRFGSVIDTLVVGLGNPGAEFEHTRHNVGADTVLLLAARGGERFRTVRGANARAAELRIEGHKVVAAFPLTYMNDSGLAVGALVRRYGIDDLENLVVVHDELDLPVGRIKVKQGGGTAGHNGLKSIHAHLHDHRLHAG